MTDDRTRELKLHARKTGAATDWATYLGALRFDDERVQNICYDLLEENPTGAKRPAISTLAHRGGIWLEQDQDYLIIHGAQHRAKDDETRQPYTLSWNRESRPSTIESHHAQLPIIRFTYGEIPTLPEIDATVRATEHARRVGRQTELANTLCALMRATITEGMCTSDKITYGDMNIKRLTRAYGRRDQEETDVNFRTGYDSLRRTERALQTLFNTTEPMDAIERRYNNLLDVRHGTWRYFMRPATEEHGEHETPQADHEEIIVLERRIMQNNQISVMSIIGGDLTINRPLRLLHTDKIQ